MSKYMDIEGDYETCDIVIQSVAYDGTTSFRPGTRFGPQAIRENSIIGYETYSPVLKKDLEDMKIFDNLDIDISYADPKVVIKQIKEATLIHLKNNKKIVTLGGEHSITAGIIEAYSKMYDDFYVIHIDAHTDLREEYLGSKYSHACVLKRVCDSIGADKVLSYGIRSGLASEFDFAQKNLKYSGNNLLKFKDELMKIKDKKIYITLDLDVLDPAYFSGTGTPEPNGLTSRELFELIYTLKELNKIIGFDIVELAPTLDVSQSSTAMAIKILREMLLIV